MAESGVHVALDQVSFERAIEDAQVSRASAYRRWPTKAELALAAIRHQGARDPVDEPDTGSLRGDLLEPFAMVAHYPEFGAGPATASS